MRLMPKINLEKNVLIEAKKRIKETFNNFEKIYISFSGGKDSTVMLHLVMEEAIKRKRKIGILFIDLEGQYKLTIDHIKNCFELYKKNSEIFWVCLPIHLRNGVSVYEPFWLCWDKKKKDAWVRELPKKSISNEKYFPFFKTGMEFEEFVPEFGEWYSQGKNCACFVGIRANESLNRFRTIANTSKITFNKKQWTTKVTEHTYNVYPIYDWTTEDIWIYQGKNLKKPYNKLYDLMHKAGLTIHQQRICQPYGDDQRKGLWLFHLIEPETWGKIVLRVNGANIGSLYISESGNFTGYRNITKPKNHTWKSFAKLLIDSMPPKTKDHYRIKIAIFLNWWKQKGYEKNIPQEAEKILESKKKVPTWRRICKTILRNDYWCKGLGFSQQKSSAYLKYLKLKKRRGQIWKMN